MDLDTAEPALRHAVERLWLAVGELVLTVYEDRPRAADLAVVDDLAEQALELQADVAAARELLATTGAAGPATHLPEASARLHAASTRYWHRLRAHDPVAELRRAARRYGGELPAWQRSVEAGAQRCEEPLAACADAFHLCWHEMCRRRSPQPESFVPVTAPDPRRSP